MQNPLTKLLSPITWLHALAWRLYNTEHYAFAVALWKASWSLGWRPCSTLAGLSRSYFCLGRKQLAIENFKKLIEQPKLSPNDWLQLEHTAFTIGEDQIVLDTLRSAWSIYPENAEIFENLLNELTRQKLNTEILSLIAKIKDWKQDIGTVGLVWQAYINLKQFDEALAWLENSRHIIPYVNYNDWYFRTLTHSLKTSIKAGDIEQALIASKKVAIDEKNLGCFKILATQLRALKRFDEAADIIEKIVDFGIPEYQLKSAIVILANAKKYEAAFKLSKQLKKYSEKIIFQTYLYQLQDNNSEAENTFNKYMEHGEYSKLNNFSLGLNNISFVMTAIDGNSPKQVEEPLVSIIMTCFNDAKFLTRAVKSIQNQEIQNFELFIVDDASQDETFKLAQDLAAQDSRIKAYKNQFNSGPYFSKNSMLCKARGKYLAFHDADDVSHPQRLKEQIQVIEDNRNEGVFASMCYHIRICEETGKLVERGFNFLTESPISLVLPRVEFLKTFGAFDTVRAGGDSELIRRIQAYLGNSSIRLIEYPFYMASYRMGSLTTDPDIGICTDRTESVRQIYREATDFFHQKIKCGLASAYKYFPPRETPYIIPTELMIKSLPN